MTAEILRRTRIAVSRFALQIGVSALIASALAMPSTGMSPSVGKA